jgi:hypothetical protein
VSRSSLVGVLTGLATLGLAFFTRIAVSTQRQGER